MPLNILYDAQIFRQQRYGGISRYFCELAPRVARAEGAAACILAPRHRNAYLRDVRSEVVVGWYSGRTSRPSWPHALAMQATQHFTVARFKPDIVHETYFFGPQLQAPRALRVLTIYDMIHERFPTLFQADNRDAKAKREAALRADHVLCISESTRRDVMNILGLPASKLTVTHLSASLRPTAVDGPSGTKERPYLLYVGERGGYKNFQGLLAAMRGSALLAELQLLCFGGGPLNEDEWAAVDRLGLQRTRITQRGGDDTTLAALYAGALCFVYPSLYEGFGIPPLEAMQCGCPVACSNTSSIPEVVGEACVYFDPAQPDSIRHALEQVVGSETLRAELRARGHRQAQNYSWDRCAETTLKVYRGLLGAGTG